MKTPTFTRPLNSGAGVGFVTLTPSPGPVVALVPAAGVVAPFTLEVVTKVVAAAVVGGAVVGASVVGGAVVGASVVGGAVVGALIFGGSVAAFEPEVTSVGVLVVGVGVGFGVGVCTGVEAAGDVGSVVGATVVVALAVAFVAST